MRRLSECGRRASAGREGVVRVDEGDGVLADADVEGPVGGIRGCREAVAAVWRVSALMTSWAGEGGRGDGIVPGRCIDTPCDTWRSTAGI